MPSISFERNELGDGLRNELTNELRNGVTNGLRNGLRDETGNELSAKSYVLSGHKAFLHRYADTGFRTKWCGLWCPPLKFFEYFAFRINGEWLSPENTEKIALENGIASHEFSLKSGCQLAVSETVFVPKNHSAVISVIRIKNTSGQKKSVAIDLEAAVNIRSKEENVHNRLYDPSFSPPRRAVFVKSRISGSAASAAPGSPEAFAAYGICNFEKKVFAGFKKTQEYKEHSPGGELQRCFIPGIYSVSFDLDSGEETAVPFAFAGSFKGMEPLLCDYDFCFNGAEKLLLQKRIEKKFDASEINTPDAEISAAYSWCCESVNCLLHKSDFGIGLFAGYPWFLEFWGRDTFLSLLGLIDMGEFSKAKEILKTLALFQKRRMPCFVKLNRDCMYHGADVDALFLIALDYYVEMSGDFLFEAEMEKNIAKSVDSLELVDYLVLHKGEETWMDSILRPGAAIEIQSLWIEALKNRESAISKKMREKLISEFWNGESSYFNDTAGEIHSEKKAPNALFPLFLKQTDGGIAQRALETAKGELLCSSGVRTLSAKDKSYSPRKYHEGASWGFINAVAAGAFMNYGKSKEALSCLKPMACDVSKNILGGMFECADSDTGELLGCGMQLWSSALFIHVFDRCFFGIRHHAQSKTLVLEPKLPEEWDFLERKNKKIGGDIFDFSIKKTFAGQEIAINFKVAPKRIKRISLRMPKEFCGVALNGKKYPALNRAGAKGSGKMFNFAASKKNLVCLIK